MTALATTTLDRILTLQLAVAWAGEALTDPPRLGWWRTAMADEYGGDDLFARLAPATARWAVLQVAREAARRVDAKARATTADADRLVTLFFLGFDVDEHVDERLRHLKHATPDPKEALPGLAITASWRRDAFAAWLGDLGAASHKVTPAGRRLQDPPVAVDRLAEHLAAALSPLAERYPLPHVVR